MLQGMWNPPSLGIELCIGRQILFHWATREVPRLSLIVDKWMGLPLEKLAMSLFPWIQEQQQD